MATSIPDGWRESILSRSRFILETLGMESGEGKSWMELLQDVLAQQNGSFFTWLAITGCYPDKDEHKDFTTQITSYGLSQSVKNTISVKSKDPELAKRIAIVELVSPKFNHLVDITHTYSAPYLTGIQRVVIGVTDGPTNITTFAWLGDSGIIQEKTIQKIQTAEKEPSTLRWRIRLVHFLHAQVPKFDKTRLGSQTRKTFLPSARKIKKRLINDEINRQIKEDSGGRLTNILIIGSKITIPEIPPSLRVISTYEVILEYEIVPVQVILYDFIPFFHGWTVHYGTRGHFVSYIRIVLLATRIVSISSLVQQQAKLITQAFRLERDTWSSRKQNFVYMDLPSGLKPANSKEFRKQKNLVVMAGSLEPRKNHLQLFGAIDLLAREGINVKVKILGSAGWNNENLLEKIYDLQEGGVDIERLGNLTDSEMRQQIAEAQVLLQISEAEGFGLPIAEALALGTKVIVSNIRPLNEWKDSRVSIIELGDIEQLKFELSNILSNPETEGIVSEQEITWEDWHHLLFREESAF